MGFSDAVRTCLRNYITFSGRASRPEYWYFALFIFLGNVVLNIADYMFFGGQTTTTMAPGSVGFQAETNGPLASLFWLAMILPSLAAGWRRMHDTGRSGLFLLYPFIVMIGIVTFIGLMSGFGTLMSGNIGDIMGAMGATVLMIAMVVFMLSPLVVLWWLTRPSQPGDNQYGPAPTP